MEEIKKPKKPKNNKRRNIIIGSLVLIILLGAGFSYWDNRSLMSQKEFNKLNELCKTQSFDSCGSVSNDCVNPWASAGVGSCRLITACSEQSMSLCTNNAGCRYNYLKNECEKNKNLPTLDEKPVIYLYPEQEQEVLVELDYHGEFIVTYPSYDESIGGWEVTAFPNGRLINHADNREYSYLFWEGNNYDSMEIDWSQGFVVEGEDTVEFLQSILPKIGLTPVEYNEFIVYWYPLMKDNTYNLIHFVGDEYTENAPLTTTPANDSMLRVFMVYKALDEFKVVEPQTFEPFVREGFTVVEWGGSLLK